MEVRLKGWWGKPCLRQAGRRYKGKSRFLVAGQRFALSKALLGMINLTRVRRRCLLLCRRRRRNARRGDFQL